MVTVLFWLQGHSRVCAWSAGIDNTETNRRDWRELLYTAPDLGKYISGAIMFEETLYQSSADGKPFVDILREQNIMPGIKVDGGLEASLCLLHCGIVMAEHACQQSKARLSEQHITCWQWLISGLNGTAQSGLFDPEGLRMW